MDFLNDRPFRKPLDEVPEKVTESLRVYLFASGTFFLERDKDMLPFGEVPSQKVVDQVKMMQGHKIIYLNEPHHFLAEPLEEQGFEVVKDNAASVIATIAFLKQRLQELGIRFKPSKNPREMSALNLTKFAVGPLTIVKANDYTEIGITPDKEKTFQDFAEQRKADAWP